jgi:hypothetical protein
MNIRRDQERQKMTEKTPLNDGIHEAYLICRNHVEFVRIDTETDRIVRLKLFEIGSLIEIAEEKGDHKSMLAMMLYQILA